MKNKHNKIPRCHKFHRAMSLPLSELQLQTELHILIAIGQKKRVLKIYLNEFIT